MTTLRVALDAAQMLAISKQVAVALDQMGRGARSAGREFDGFEQQAQRAGRNLDLTRESLKATAGAIQTAGNIRNLVDSLKQIDGGFAGIADVAANAAQTVLSFARAFDDFKDVQQIGTVFVDLPGPLNQAAQAADGLGDAAQAAGAAIGAQAAATSTATGATSLFTRATLALRAAWAAHPVLLIGTVLAAAATAMAAFGSSTRKTADDTAKLADQQRALEQALKNVQRIQAEGSLGQQFGIAGAADAARRREQEAVFQQAVNVEQMRRQEGGRGQVPISSLTSAGPSQLLIMQDVERRQRFAQEVDREAQRLQFLEAQNRAGQEGLASLVEFSVQELNQFKIEATKTVRDSFVVGYDEAIQILQGRFDEIGKGIRQAAEAANQQAQPSGVAYGISASMGRVQAQIDAEVARRQVIDQITAGIAEENRLAGLTEAAREREIALLRIKQEAAQQGVTLSAQELANIEAQFAARDQQAQINAEIARRAVIEQINAQLSEEYRLVGLTENVREREVELLRIKQEAAQQGVELTQQELANIEAQLAARQRQSQLQRQAEFNRDVVQPSEEGLYLAGFDPNEREIQAAIAAAQAQAQSSGVQLRQAEADQIRANMEAMQQMEVLRATGQEVGSALGNAFVNAATGVGTLRQALAGLLQDLLRIAAQRAILGPLANAIGGIFAGFGNTPSQQQSNIEARNMTYEPS
jgi:hypothetical protein